MDRLRRIMEVLRGPGGCPWDAEQTHESLLKHLLEEAYEVAAAVRAGERDAIVDELGDLLLQPVFHGVIGAERGDFDFDDIARAICEKLIRRHPHVFGESDAADAEAVLKQWEEIKAMERGASPGAGTDPARHPVEQKIKRLAKGGLPALMTAAKIQQEVAKVGFDWDDVAPVFAKVFEELVEVQEALRQATNPPASAELAEELGDLLFAVVNLTRVLGGEAEQYLQAANQKFVTRFSEMTALLEEGGGKLGEANLEQMDAAWNKAKEQNRMKAAAFARTKGAGTNISA
jgi:MazG family protein